MKNDLTIYLMRHGLDDEKYIGGWSDIGLVESGIKQIENTTNLIADNIKDIKVIYHSGLKRTIDTAEIVNKSLCLPMYALDSLKELNKGELNGMEIVKAKELYSNYFPNPAIDQKYSNGESLLDLYKRVKQFVDNIDIYDKSLLITHRGFINMIYFILSDMEINYDKEQFNVTHSSIHKLEKGKIKRILP